MNPLTQHWRSLYTNAYLGAWNLYVQGRYMTVTVTIERAVQEQTVMEGGRKSLALLVYFAGKRTPLIVTKKMGKVIASMHGPRPMDWIGREITLYVEQGFLTRDGLADVLRVRNDKAGAGMRRALQRPPEDDGPPAEVPELETFAEEDDNAPT